MAKTQKPSMYDPHFKEFTVLSLTDFVQDDRYETFSASLELSRGISAERSSSGSSAPASLS